MLHFVPKMRNEIDVYDLLFGYILLWFSLVTQILLLSILLFPSQQLQFDQYKTSCSTLLYVGIERVL